MVSYILSVLCELPGSLHTMVIQHLGTLRSMVLPGQDGRITLEPVLAPTVCPPAEKNTGEEGGGRGVGGREGEGG